MLAGDHDSRGEHELVLGFMESLAKLEALQPMCCLAARTLSGLADTLALVWVRDGDADHGRGWGAAVSSSGQTCPLQAGSPWPGRDLPAQVLAELEGSPTASGTIHTRALGLRDDATLHLSSARVLGKAGRAVWIGLCGTKQASPRALRVTRLVAHHLLSVATLVWTRAHGQDFEIKYRTMVEQLPAFTYYRDFGKAGRPAFISAQVEEILGYTPEEFVDNRALFIERLHPEDRERVLALQERKRHEGFTDPYSTDYRMLHRDGHTVWLRNHTLAARNDAGEHLFVLGIVFDVSDIKQLEQDYLHAQKMEAVGRLAGGIAHDFNNILTIIMGHTEFAHESLDPGSQSAEDLAVVLDASDQARRLVAQLLAFSRRQVRRNERLELVELLGRMREMVARVLREDIEFVFDVDAELGAVMADRGQLEQVIMNLLVNARDAMPEGGRLVLRARDLKLSEPPRAACEPIAPGDYVMFSISDTGVGIDDYTRERLFEPFFTTKEQGTGLGLSTVLGLVRQHGGTLAVISELGRGTTMEVYLPRAEA